MFHRRAKIYGLATLLLSLLAPIADAGTPYCPEAYLRLSETSGRERKELRKAIRRAEKNLGFAPEFTIREGVVIARSPKEQRLGHLHFEISRGHTLHVEDLQVEKEFRRQGLSEALMATVLKERPAIERIETDALVGTNEKVLKKARRRGFSCKDAIRATPAYQMRKRLGFGKLVKFDCEEAHFTVERD